VVLNVVVYSSARAQTDPNPWLRLRVDGGRSRHLTGRLFRTWTVADRTLPLPASACGSGCAPVGFANQAGPAGLLPRRIAIALGDDLARGAHIVELQAGGLGPAWARFFVSREGASEERAYQWRYSGADRGVAKLEAPRQARAAKGAR
jgi:hypothetical protein